MKRILRVYLFVATLSFLNGCEPARARESAAPAAQATADESADSLARALRAPETTERLITEAAQIPAEIGTLTNLKSLHLGRPSWGSKNPHPLKTLPPEIGRLKNLERLSIYKAAELKQLPPEIGGLEELKELMINGFWHRGTRDEVVGVTPGYLYERRGAPLYPLGLQELPDEFGNLSNLEKLILYNTEAQTLPESIGKLKKLNFVFFAHGDMRVIPPEIGGCESLEVMNMPDNPLMENFPPEIGNCKNLRSIWSNLNTARTAIPKEIGKLQRLAFLELGGSGLKIVPPELGNCQRLHSLSLGGGAYTALPPELGNLRRLAFLGLKGSKLASIPPQWDGMHQLTYLQLNRTKVQGLPPEMGRLGNLRFIDLRGTQVTTVPESFQALEKLEFIAADQPLADQIKALLPHVKVSADDPADPMYRIPLLLFRNIVERALGTGKSRTTPNNKNFTLDWQNRGLAFVEIPKPEQVAELRLNGNQLTQIPAFIFKAKNLAQVDLSGNPIPAEAIRELQQKRPTLKIILDSPPPVILAQYDFSKACYAGLRLRFSDPSSVRQIQLDYNEFKQLPDFLSEMENLETLDLDVNLIVELPDAIAMLSRLHELSIGANQLTRISPKIGTLQHLEVLDLSVNALKTLPDEMADLKKLRKLDLSGNEFETLPQVLFRLENLETLDLRGNLLAPADTQLLQEARPSLTIYI